MALNPTYSVGTVSVSAGETVVTGAGTLWLAAGVQAGDIFERAGLTATVVSVASNTSLTLARAWPGSAVSGGSYEIRYTPDAARVLASARQVVELLDGGNLPALSDLPSAGNTLPYFVGPGAAAVTPITSLGRDILAQSTPQAVRAALGLAGYAGAGIRIQGVVASAGALPATGNTIGDAYLVGSNPANLYVWGGAAPWSNAGPVSGTAGLDGLRVYGSRSEAVAAAPNLASTENYLFHLDGSALVARLRTSFATDPLFPSGSRWGVVLRQDTSETAPIRLTVTAADAATPRNANSWTAPSYYRNVVDAPLTFPSALPPLGTVSPYNAQVDTLPHVLGSRMIWRDVNGSVHERIWNGSAWSAWVQQPSAAIIAAEQSARVSGDAANAAAVSATVQAQEEFRAALSSAPDAGADVGRALIEYEDGRVALAQRSDGLYFIASQQLRNELGGSGGGGEAAPVAPAGGWAAQVIDGTTFFTAPAGCSLIDRFRLIVSAWRLTARPSRVICHYGQSNAGVTLMSEPLHWPGAPVRHCVTLNDRTPTNGGVRGLIGSVPTITPTAFEQVVEVGNVQSIVSATGAMLATLDKNVPLLNVVRTEARGGQPFIGTNDNIVGIWKTVAGVQSQIFINLIQSITNMVNISAAQGFPVGTIYIPFTHQENDRADTRAGYLANWLGFKADVENALASLGKPIIWLLDQASGSGVAQDGGAWPNRMSVYDATLTANGGANVRMVMPRYHLPFGPGTQGGWDWIHHSYASRVIQGETLAYAIQEIEAGRSWRCAWPVSSSIVGNAVIVNFDSITPLTIDPSFCKVRPDMGFGVVGRTVTSVSVTGPRQVTIVCDGPPASGALLSYAYRAKDQADVEDEWAISTGALRETWTVPSRFVSGARILRPALGFQIPVGA